MCGIVGSLSPTGAIGTDVVAELNAGQLHRGPDDQVVTSLGPFVVGNTRLAIQDPTPEGNQPFVDPTGRYTVVFNGELYNFRELVREHGLQPITHCDGEVIPLLWARYGIGCLPMLRGMFGLAVVDQHEQRLHLARDPFGIKPLWWRRFRDGICFASEVKPLWRLDRVLAVDPGALGEFLQYGAVSADRSPFAGIEALAPGSCISFGLDARPRFETSVPALDPALAEPVSGPTSGGGALARSLNESVRLHLQADVPTALLLSAGMDSSFIAFAAREAGRSLHCLTVTGAVGEDESPQAEATAQEYGHSHERVPATIDATVVSGFFEAMQRPSVDGLNSYLVSRAVARAGFKVALSGLGGDEALGGYRYARYLRILPALRLFDLLPEPAARPVRARIARRLPASGSGSDKLTRLLGRGGPRTPSALVELQRELHAPAVVGALGAPRPAPSAVPRGARGYRAMAVAELHRYLQPILLQDADAYSMAVSVELRVPFVDRWFFAAALGRHDLVGKDELVAQLGDPYLLELSRRPKTGFAMPMQDWLRGGVLADVVADAARPDAPVWSVLDREAGLPILATAGTAARWSAPWSLAALDGWLRHL